MKSWPPQSPDLNLSEELWDKVDRKMRNTCPRLKKKVVEKIPPHTCNHFTLISRREPTLSAINCHMYQINTSFPIAMIPGTDVQPWPSGRSSRFISSGKRNQIHVYRINHACLPRVSQRGKRLQTRVALLSFVLATPFPPPINHFSTWRFPRRMQKKRRRKETRKGGRTVLHRIFKIYFSCSFKLRAAR